jgi:hypothetical protein
MLYFYWQTQPFEMGYLVFWVKYIYIYRCFQTNCCTLFWGTEFTGYTFLFPYVSGCFKTYYHEVLLINFKTQLYPLLYQIFIFFLEYIMFFFVEYLDWADLKKVPILRLVVVKTEFLFSSTLSISEIKMTSLTFHIKNYLFAEISNF